MKTGIEKYMGICVAVCVSIAATLLGSCNMTGQSAQYLTSFAFTKANNPWLSKDIIGTIDEAFGTVNITVPEEAYQYSDSSKKGHRKFKASFTVRQYAKLYKGTAEQKSGEMQDLFIKNKEYKVVAKDGSSKKYTVRIKIAYATPSVKPADTEAIKQFYGSYSGKLHFDNNYYDICLVYNQGKLISYSQPMSAMYTNVQWEKKSATEWVCTAYHKNDFKRKEARNTVTFKAGPDGKITCQLVVNAMGNAPSNLMEKDKGGTYLWSSGDGKGFKEPTEA